MIRLIAILVGAFLLPFVAHGCTTLVRGRGFRPLPYTTRGKLWLVAFGLVLSAAALISLLGSAPKVLGERYIPAHMEGNVLVPGKFVSGE
jgi:hypothetical protein